MSPVRTCVGCRSRSDKARLIRLVVSSGTILVDTRQTSPGRGAYLHRKPGCWTQAMRRRTLTRQLPVAVIDSEQLFDDLTDAAQAPRA